MDSPKNDVSFGVWLRKQRRLLDLSRQALADQVGCAEITLRRIEAGSLKPSKELALILLEKLGVPEQERPQWLPFARGLSRYQVEFLDHFVKKPPNNLPASLTLLIDREQEQVEIARLIDQHRLVTLTGSGGVGKTSLSLRVAATLLDKFPDGVWLVELALISDPSLIAATTADALHLPAEMHRPAIEMLCDYLREKELLIVLDNCEHLVEACAQVVARLLRAAPKLRILASGREALGITGEVSYRVPSLALPDITQPPDFESLRKNDSVRLFGQRAASAFPKFQLTDENVYVIAQICQCLDGIPLAIELAAAKVRVLSVSQIAERLDDAFRLLVGGSRTALKHHQTLRATLDWSYNLLSPDEQTLFRRASIFVKGFTLEAAEAVCVDEPARGGIRTGDMLNLLERLVDKSLILTEAWQSETRYRALEIVRQYAAEKLSEAGEDESQRENHLEYFLNLAEAAAPHLTRPEQLAWLARLEAEHENMRAALEWSLRKEQPEYALRLAVALCPFWHIHCYWLEGSRWLERALSKPSKVSTAAEKIARSRALYWDADLAQNLGYIERSKASAEASLALCETGTERRDLAIARFFVGFAYNRQGSSDTARVLIEQSLAEFHELQDWFWVAVAQRWLSFILVAKGEMSPGEQIARDLEMARKAGERFSLSSALLNRANWAWENYQIDAAESYLEESETLSYQIGFRAREADGFLLRGEIAHYNNDYQQARIMYDNNKMQQQLLGEKYLISFTLENLGILARDMGEWQQAQSHYDDALQAAKLIGDRSVVGFRLALLGQIYFIQGHFEGARRAFQESLSVIIELDDLYSKSNPLLIFSSTYADMLPQIALQVLGAIHAYYENKIKNPMHPLRKRDYDKAMAQARQSLEESAFNSAWVDGEKMSLDEALNLTLKTLAEM